MKDMKDTEMDVLVEYRLQAAVRYHQRKSATHPQHSSQKVISNDTIIPRCIIPGLSDYILRETHRYLTGDPLRAPEPARKWHGYVGKVCEGVDCWEAVMGREAEAWRMFWEGRGGGGKGEGNVGGVVYGSGILGSGFVREGWMGIRRKVWEGFVERGGKKVWEGMGVLGSGNVERKEEWMEVYLERLFGREERRVEMGDCYEDVLKRYCGKPFELYRRKASKRFAGYRRRTSVEEGKAERMRKRSRAVKVDRLMSGEGRATPFLYANENVTWMYCDGWGAEGRKRKMVKRYAEMSENDIDSKLERLEKAKNIAQSAPMFHTKVMNRFV